MLPQAGGKKRARPWGRQTSSSSTTAAAAAAATFAFAALSVTSAFSFPLGSQPFHAHPARPQGRKTTTTTRSSLLRPQQESSSQPSPPCPSCRETRRTKPRRVACRHHHHRVAGSDAIAASGGAHTTREGDSRRQAAVSPRLQSRGGIAGAAADQGRVEDSTEERAARRRQLHGEKSSCVIASASGSSVQVASSSPSAVVLDRKGGVKELSNSSRGISSSSSSRCSDHSNGVIASKTGSPRQLQDYYYYYEDGSNGAEENRRRWQHQQRQRRRGIPAALAEYEIVQEGQGYDDRSHVEDDNDNDCERDNGSSGSNGSSRMHGNKRHHIVMGLRDNDARMFLLERGLSQGELRRVMPVMRRDPRLISDVGVLAARMQALSGMLEAASAGSSWYRLSRDPNGKNDTHSAAMASPPLPYLHHKVADRNSTPSSSSSFSSSRERLLDATLCDSDVQGDGYNPGGDGRGQEDEEEEKGKEACLSGGGGGDGLSAGDDGYYGDEMEEAQDESRILAYQMIASEPRLLLLLEDDSKLASRLHFLLDLFPGLRRGDTTRLCKAACLLVQPSDMLETRVAGMKALLLPRNVHVQAAVCQAPMLVSHSVSNIALALEAVETLVPGVRLDRLLRSAPQLVVQPMGVVERRLHALREVLNLPLSPEAEQEKAGNTTSRSSPGRRRQEGNKHTSTLARFANAFPRILTMDPRLVRDKISDFELLLPGLNGLALVTSKPRLLGFQVMGNVYAKVRRLRALLELKTDADLTAAVSRCPSLLTMSSGTLVAKLGKLQEALPSGLDARTLVGKAPRLLSRDMDSSVPRKVAQLAQAFAVHAEANAEETAEIVGQVLTYNPDALLYDPTTLDSKLAVLRKIGVPSATLRTIVRDAPRCLAVAAEVLEVRVSALGEAFPTVPLSRLLGEAPRLLLKKIDYVAQAQSFRELFPTVDPARLVHGAPMLLALSRKTLRVKRDAWRCVLEPRIDTPWEQAIAEFPQVLCQGLGRAARIVFLQGSENMAPPLVALLPTEGNGGDDSPMPLVGLREACRVVRMSMADFAKDYPTYPAFVDSLLAPPSSAFTFAVGTGFDSSSSSSSSTHGVIVVDYADSRHHAPAAGSSGSGSSIEKRVDCYADPPLHDAVVFQSSSNVVRPVAATQLGEPQQQQQQQQPLPPRPRPSTARRRDADVIDSNFVPVGEDNREGGGSVGGRNSVTGSTCDTGDRDSDTGCTSGGGGDGGDLEVILPAITHANTGIVGGGPKATMVGAATAAAAPGILGNGVEAMGEKVLGVAMMAKAKESRAQDAVDMLTQGILNSSCYIYNT